MRLTKYPDVETIRETKMVVLTDGLEIEIQDLPPTYGDDVQAVLPTPRPKVLGPLKDSKGRIERDERTGKPIMLYEDDDPEYLKKVAETQTLQLVYLVMRGVADGQFTFDAQHDPSDPLEFYRNALAEMKDFGFGMGQVTRIARAVKDLSGITDEDVEKATADFSSGAD